MQVLGKIYFYRSFSEISAEHEPIKSLYFGNLRKKNEKYTLKIYTFTENKLGK